MLIGLLPAAVVCVSMFLFHNVFAAMFLMHSMSMALVIVGVTFASEGASGLKWYSTYIKSQRFTFSTISFLFSGFLLVVSGYILSSCRVLSWTICVGSVDENIADYGFHNAPLGLIIATMIYFPLFNPIVEELFWRVFMMRIGGCFTAESMISVGLPVEEEVGLVLPAAQNVNPGTVPPNTLQALPSTLKLLLSALYASYHTVVVGVFLGGVWYGVLAFFAITGLGMLFLNIFSYYPVDQGFYPAVLLHVGIDVGVVIALGDSIGWYSLF
jgi:hypothetical protein